MHRSDRGDGAGQASRRDVPGGVVREADAKRDAEVFVADPLVASKCSGTPPEGKSVEVRLAVVDVDRRTVSFAYEQS